MDDAPLIASGITKRFGKRLVLDHAGLVLRRGEVVAIVGENGVGKTSLLRICAGFLDADAGTVERRGRLGYCPQQPALFELLTAREHLVLFGRAIGLDRGSALEQGNKILREFGVRTGDDTVAKSMSGYGRSSTSRSPSSVTRTCFCSTSPTKASTTAPTSTSGTTSAAGASRTWRSPW